MTRLAVHSAVLAAVNLGGLWLGFLAFFVLGGSSQVGIQLPVALLLSAGGYVLWTRWLATHGRDRLRLRGWRDAGGTLVLAAVWAAIVFVPTHYVVRGYLTAFGNLLAIWLFQLVANGLALGADAVMASDAAEPDSRAS